MATATRNPSPAGTTPGTLASDSPAGGALVPTGGGAAALTPATLAPGVAAPAATGTAQAPAGMTVLTRLPAAARAALERPAMRSALPAIAIMAALVIAGAIYAWMQSTPYRPVMPNLTEADRQVAFEALRTASFSPRIDPVTGQILVPGERFHEARMLLAAQGLPKSGTTGLESLKDHSSMTSTQFMEQVRVNAAMEQELARSIMQIATVQTARVHLATPKQSAFVRERVPPKASVVVNPYPGRVVAPQQVQAIVHLVSSSVPYLAAEHVTVVDTHGNLITEAPGQDKLGLTAAQSLHKQQQEDLYRTRIMQILGPVVGEANVRSQVNLSLDFTQVESTSEDYDSRDKGPKTRSETSSQDRNAKREAAGIPGSLSNTAPQAPTTSTETAADTNKGQSDSQETVASKMTRNYELDRNVRHVKNAPGVVQRVTVAVVLNERAPAPGAAAEAGGGNAADANARRPYSEEELQRFQQLVRGVVGFDAGRGDTVSVVQARFETPPAEVAPWYQEPLVQESIKPGLLALSFIAFLLLVVRPLMRGANPQAGTQPGANLVLEGPAEAPPGELTAEDMKMIQIGEGESLEEIKAKLRPKKSSISADMLDTANTYDDKVALIRMLVAEDSGRVANVLKGMIRVG